MNSIMLWKIHVSYLELESQDRVYEKLKYKIFHMGVSDFVSGCPGGVSCRVLTIFSLYVGPSLGKPILYKLVCKFDRMPISFSSLCKFISIVTIYIYHHLSILHCSIFHIHLSPLDYFLLENYEVVMITNQKPKTLIYITAEKQWHYNKQQ